MEANTTNKIPPTDPRRGYLNGYSIAFKRRRYGSRQTFTWVWAKRDDDDGPMIQLGDPWPCVSPKRAEVHAEVLRCLYGVGNEYPAGSPTGSDRTGTD